MISRFVGMLTTRAPSSTRATSSGIIGRDRSGIATMPRLFRQAMCAPATPTCADRIRVPLDRSAFSTDVLIDSVASRMFSTIPRDSPAEGAMPTPSTRTSSSVVTSPTTVATFVVPMSIAANVPPLAIRSLPGKTA